MVSWPDNFKTKALERMKDFFFLCINREFGQDIATSVSAINASFGKPNFLITLGPKVLMWNKIADFVSERASSYVSPSPTTTPSKPSGYPTYPSSSLEMTILNFLNRCILLPPIRSIAYRKIGVKDFPCLIDDVRIYPSASLGTGNYARTAEQILQDYNAGAAARLGD